MGEEMILNNQLPREVHVGEIEAWRFWRISEQNNRIILQSAFRPDIWRNACMDGNTSSGYGVHAWKRPYLPEDYSQWCTAKYGAFVLGRVHLWGEVIEHEWGYRGEHARIISLDEGATNQKLNRARRAYGLKEVPQWKFSLQQIALVWGSINKKRFFKFILTCMGLVLLGNWNHPRELILGEFAVVLFGIIILVLVYAKR